MTRAVFTRGVRSVAHALRALSDIPKHRHTDIRLRVNDQEALTYLEMTDDEKILELAQCIYDRRSAYFPEVGEKALKVIEQLSPAE